MFDLLQSEYKEATDFGKEIIPHLFKNIKWSVINTMATGQISGISILSLKPILNLTADLPEFNLFDNSKAIYTRARMLPPAKISGTTLEKTLIAEGCIINASRIENSVAGIRSRIEHGTTVVSSYVMGNDYFETLDDIANANKAGIPLLGYWSPLLYTQCDH